MPHKPSQKQRKLPKPTKSFHKTSNSVQSNLFALNQALDNSNIELALQISQKILSSPSASLQELDEAFQTFSAAGDSQRAIQTLNIAISKEHLSTDAAYRFIARFSISGSVKDLEQAINIIPRTKEHQGTLIFALGRLHEFQLSNDLEKSVLTLQKLAEADSTSAIFNIQKACHFLVQNDLVSLEEHLLTFLDSFWEIPATQLPDQPFLLGLSRCLSTISQFENSEKVINAGLELSPDDPVLVHELAWICNLEGDFEEAILLLQKVVYLYGDQGAVEQAKDAEMKIQWIQEQIIQEGQKVE
eukprot:EST44441.1 hypothetical protein SS50377_15749 [Spironucleus salmonicida]